MNLTNTITREIDSYTIRFNPKNNFDPVFLDYILYSYSYIIPPNKTITIRQWIENIIEVYTMRNLVNCAVCEYLNNLIKED